MNDRYPLLVVIDGEQARSNGEMDKSLDNLIGKTVAPMIVAFVPAVDWREFGGSKTVEFTRAQVEELIPLLDKTFRTDARRESRAVMGQRGGGSAAIFVALHHPEAFSHAAAQSFEFGDLEEDLTAASGETHDLALMFHWGHYDRSVARRDSESVVEALQENGYRPKTFDSYDGYGWAMWQGRTAEILQALFPLQ